MYLSHHALIGNRAGVCDNTLIMSATVVENVAIGVNISKKERESIHPKSTPRITM